MKATEFRIGNLVEDENGFYQIESECLEEDYFNTLQCWGIKLTEEWLIKFGFSENWQKPIPEKFKGSLFAKANNEHTIMIFIVLCKDNENLGLINDGRSSQYLPCKIKHVHQLQNLYFALTGTELTINKPKEEQR